MQTKTDLQHTLITIFNTISSTGSKIYHLAEHSEILFHAFCKCSDFEYW